MKTSYQVLLLIGICIFSFFVQLDEFHPDLMEVRNFITAREMIVEGNWISTTMNLEPRLEKPPLPTWLTAISALSFGGFNNLYAMRLPGALVATAMVLFFFGYCREIKKEGWFALIGASFLATSLLMLQMGRTNSWDIYTHAFMVGSIWQFTIALNRKKQIHVLYSMIFMGLSVLSKGPVSLYALWLPFIIALQIGKGKGFVLDNWKKLLFIILGGLIIGFSWNICMSIFQPEATEFVLNKETNSWANRHVRPFYFYLHFPIYIGVWTILVISSFFYKYAKPAINRYSNYKFVLSWILLVVLFLSVIPTKKERYLLPVMVPLCLAAALIAENIYVKFKSKAGNKWDKLIFGIQSILIFSVSIIFAIGGFFVFSFKLISIASLSLVLIGIIGVGGLYWYKKENVLATYFGIIAIISVFCFGLLPETEKKFYHYNEFNDLANIQNIEELKGLDFYYESNLVEPRVVWAIGTHTKRISSINYSDNSQFPLVFISVSNIDDIINENIKSQLDIKQIGVYDFFRKKVDWRANVYLVNMKTKK